jgi:hypothetical protein
MLDERNRKTLKVRAIAIISLAFAIFLLMLFGNHPQAVERYYSKGAYPVICLILHPFFNLFPFSAGDMLYLFTVGYLCYAVFRLIKLAYKKSFQQAGIYLLGLLAGIETGILIFYMLWGINYYRPPAGDLLNLRDTGYTTADLRSVTAMLIDSANITRARVTASELTEDNYAIYQMAIGAVRKLSHNSVNFVTYNPGIKPSLLTPLLNYIGTSGYYNPFTSEAQINYQMPIFERPVVACHEMSHQMGFATEDEANFAGFLAGIGSNDHLLRYSAYHLAVDEFMHALRYRDTIANNELKPRISTAVRNDFKTERKYWISYQSRAGVLSSIFYDKFLKANNQPHGLDTYNRMVLLVMALYKEKIRR